MGCWGIRNTRQIIQCATNCLFMRAKRGAGRSPVSGDVAAIAEGISLLFHPHAEIVVHDLKSDRIAAIWNPSSGRRPGDPSLIESDFVPPTGSKPSVLGPYEQVDVRGHRTTSVSVLVDEGRMLLCLNFDRSVIESAVGMLLSIGSAHVEQPQALFARDWRARINETIADWCRSANLVARDLTRDERRELVRHLDQLGLFDTRHAADHIANALGVSRATIYNLRRS